MTDIKPIVSVQNLKKRFGKNEAVREVSFDVLPSEVFGLLGPNGAGKTTTIRIILDIFKADAGQISVFGAPLNTESRDRIGYMPEERGLYPHMRVLDCLIYLGSLKGLDRKVAKQRAIDYLERLELGDQQRTKIETLSRGMTQKVQVIASVIHNPDLLIIDEPFANLDPINAQLVRDIFLEIRTRGGAVMMTSHQLALVETLCDRIALINQGRVVLQGTVADVRRSFARDILYIRGSGQIGSPPGIIHIHQPTATEWHLTMGQDINPRNVLQVLVANPDFTLDRFEVAMPSLDEIFVQVVRSTLEQSL